jgi:SAM-dependent methyltransferase
MARLTDGTGPGAFGEGQARAYAAASEVETAFPHDRVFLDLLRRHARGAALDLGGGNGRYAAWLLHTGLVTAGRVIDHSPPMVDACRARALPGLSASLGDIEQADLGVDHYDIALARFVLMHVRDLDATLARVVQSLTPAGTLVAVTNVIEGTASALTAFLDATAGVMPLVLRVQGQFIPVLNYARTRDDYETAFRQAGLRVACAQAYAPQILRFADEPPGVTLAHLVLVGRKSAPR